MSELPETPFEDVGPDAWYADAVRWAYANEVAAGIDDTHFAPDDRLTRAQLVTMLYRAYGPEKGRPPAPDRRLYGLEHGSRVGIPCCDLGRLHGLALRHEQLAAEPGMPALTVRSWPPS